MPHLHCPERPDERSRIMPPLQCPGTAHKTRRGIAGQVHFTCQLPKLICMPTTTIPRSPCSSPLPADRSGVSPEVFLELGQCLRDPRREDDGLAPGSSHARRHLAAKLEIPAGGLEHRKAQGTRRSLGRRHLRRRNDRSAGRDSQRHSHGAATASTWWPVERSRRANRPFIKTPIPSYSAKPKRTFLCGWRHGSKAVRRSLFRWRPGRSRRIAHSAL